MKLLCMEASAFRRRLVPLNGAGARSVLLLGAAVVLLCLAAFLSSRSSMEVRDAARQVDIASRVRRDAQAILTLATEAESGQRGYLLTGDPRYLVPYEHAVASLPDAMQRLRDLMARSDGQAERVDRIDRLLHAKSAELQ